ncbi:MAG TPA: GNAT family N-acetyltransferase [Gemmatimonadales bacterium]|jgi:GNAT superfamily N-acetyltransferase|nr:GNAT family N-acetyltransferase [Gemmatimonadales bacterium]
MDRAIRIAPATEDQTPLIVEFIRGLAEYEKLAHEVIATEESVRRSLFGARPDAEVVIAYVGEEPAGFALFFHNYSTFLTRRGLFLEDLFVKPAFRGHGVGKRLLQYLAQLAVDRGCGRFEWCVLEWNEPAIRFYQSVGARPMSDWRVFRITGDALVELAGGP